MIDILRQKSFFPLRNFEDVEKLFKFNIDERNGEPNLTLLSIVAGLIEHSLVSILDKDDLTANSRQVEHRKEIAQKKFGTNNRTPSPFTSSQQHTNLILTNSNNDNDNHPQPQDHPGTNKPDYASSNDSSDRSTSMSPEYSANDNVNIPTIEFEIVDTLYRRFVEQFKGSIEFKETESNKTNLKIKKISDSVWEHLSNSYYKDKAHLQSIFSYLTTSKLDCFGLAFAVIAGCQILNLKNIYLALSEDHAWVMFDLQAEEFKNQKEKEVREYKENNLPIPTCALHGTCEVTWHGKANSDKRGRPVTYKNCWLYTNGYAVKCDIKLCVAALVNSINPTINTNTESELLALLQQRLLWLLYHHKNYFPMSLGNLGELENISPTPNAPLTPHELFNLGIEISRNDYNDSHVYPYSYLASFFLKHGRFKEALETWADASAVMTKYNYSRDDEEIYKEFFEVANELIPSMLKVLTAGGLEPGKVSQKPFLQDPECLALILKFYDNICCWEEGSSTPVLHTGWAKNFVATVLKFSSIIRSKVKLMTKEEWSHNKPKQSPKYEKCPIPEAPELKIESNDKNESSGNKYHSNIKREINDESNGADAIDIHDSNLSNEVPKESRKRPRTTDDEIGIKEPSNKNLKLENYPGLMTVKHVEENIDKPVREKRLEVDADNNVTVILKSGKIAGLRDLLQAEKFQKNAIELQLTAQSQCAVRGRSNSSSYSSDFIPTLMTTGSSTRSKRLHR